MDDLELISKAFFLFKGYEGGNNVVYPLVYCTIILCNHLMR